MIDERGAITLFIRRLYAKGNLSIRDAYKAAAKEVAEERNHPDMDYLECHCSAPMELAVAHLLEEPETRRVGPGVAFPEGPILVPLEMSSEQEKVLAQWKAEGHSWPACAYDEGECLILDTILWKFGPGWRKLYPEIPCC